MTDPSLRLRNKLLLRLVAPLTFLTFLSSLDRVNVSFAALQMNEALALTPEQYGLGGGLFFVGYLLFQFPHTALLRQIGPRLWIFVAVLAWGAVATFGAFLQTAGQFYALRVLLGIAEAGFAPGIVYVMSQWMPRRFRASAIAGSMLAIPISVVFGGPLSGWLMGVSSRFAGWRFMFFVEGALTVLVALLTPLYFVNTPAEARWLSTAERAWLAAERARDEPADEVGREGESSASFRTMLANPSLWAAAGSWFSLMAGAYAIIFWLPQVIKQLSGRSDFEVSVISALPWVGLGAGMAINAWHSDRTQERYLHIALPALLAAVLLPLGVSIPPSALALGILVVGAFGLGAAQGAYWALPTSTLPRDVAGRGITLINLLGSSAGLVVPPMIGLIRSRTGSFALSVYVLSGLLVLGALGLRVIWQRQARGQREPVDGSRPLGPLPGQSQSADVPVNP